MDLLSIPRLHKIIQLFINIIEDSNETHSHSKM